MKKILHRSFFLMITLVLLVFFGFWFFNTSYLLSGQAKAALKREADHLVQAAPLAEQLPKELLLTAEFRYTLIAPNGKVLYDDEVDVLAMENHLERTEVAQALKTGEGSTRRHSATLGEDYFYYARRLNNGNVLRISSIVASTWALVLSAIPTLSVFMLVALVLSRFLSQKLSSRLVRPLEKFDLTDNAELTHVYSELYPFAQKITEQKEEIVAQAKQLKDQQQTLTAILENMKEGIVLLNADQSVLLANQTALFILDGPSEIRAQTTLLDLSQSQSFLTEARAALQGESRFIQISEKGRTYGVYFGPTAFDGCAILFIDLTEPMGAEKIRQEFSANVSHELKTPLTSISAYAEMISSGIAKGSAVNDFANKIHREATHLTGLISDILLISEIEEGKISLEVEEVDLVALCKTVILQLDKLAQEKNIAVTLTGGDAQLLGRQNHFYEIVFNILQNAIKYTPSKGQVTTTLCQDIEKVTIEVKDTGIGIPQKNLERVFERFYRVDKSRYKKTGGTGLGLSIVKHLVQLYGGQVFIESREGIGTKVRVVIPTQRAVEPFAKEQVPK